MVGYVVVLESDHYAMPASDGSYDIDGLEPGEYEVKVWHPDLAEWTSRVVVSGEGATRLDIDLR
jgi:hypothetical protein